MDHAVKQRWLGLGLFLLVVLVLYPGLSHYVSRTRALETQLAQKERALMALQTACYANRHPDVPTTQQHGEPKAATPPNVQDGTVQEPPHLPTHPMLKQVVALAEHTPSKAVSSTAVPMHGPNQFTGHDLHASLAQSEAERAQPPRTQLTQKPLHKPAMKPSHASGPASRQADQVASTRTTSSSTTDQAAQDPRPTVAPRLSSHLVSSQPPGRHGAPSREVTIQVASYGQPALAQQMVQQLRTIGLAALTTHETNHQGRTFTRVAIRDRMTPLQARQVVAELYDRYHVHAMVLTDHAWV